MSSFLSTNGNLPGVRRSSVAPVLVSGLPTFAVSFHADLFQDDRDVGLVGLAGGKLISMARLHRDPSLAGLGML
jgi:hypothetical protein